jgi:hypothetical protein
MGGVSTLRVFLYVGGAFFILLGIFGVVSPPAWLRKFSRWLGRVGNRLRPLVGLSPRETVYSGSLAPLGFDFDLGPISVDYWVGVAHEAPDKEKIEYLLRRDEEVRTGHVAGRSSRGTCHGKEAVTPNG